MWRQRKCVGKFERSSKRNTPGDAKKLVELWKRFKEKMKIQKKFERNSRKIWGKGKGQLWRLWEIKFDSRQNINDWDLGLALVVLTDRIVLRQKWTPILPIYNNFYRNWGAEWIRFHWIIFSKEAIFSEKIVKIILRETEV